MYEDIARSQRPSSLEWVVWNVVIPSFAVTFVVHLFTTGCELPAPSAGRLREAISYEIIPVVTPPMPAVPPLLVSIHRPDYPAAMRRAGTDGRVVLRGLVDARGRVRRSSIEVLQTTDSRFDVAARQALGGAVFWPARTSQSVEAWVTMVVAFNLDTE